MFSTFCVHRGGNIIDSPRNIGLIRLIDSKMKIHAEIQSTGVYQSMRRVTVSPFMNPLRLTY